MRLQRRCPELFTDLCFYADVCALLASFQFRATSRRFIQELFTELNFDEVRTLDFSKQYLFSNENQTQNTCLSF